MDEQQVTTITTLPARRHRGALFGLVGGTLVLGLVAGGVTVGVINSRDTTTTTAAGASVEGTSFVPPDWSAQGDSGSSSQGGTSQGGTSQGGSAQGGLSQGGTSTQNPAVAASADQQVGVVTIDTVLSYQGAAAAGTGMILSSDGLILTNNHVVEGSTAIQVTVESTGKTYTAKVVGTDATADVALLKLQDASGLDVITLDKDNGVVSGDTVTAIGNASGTGTLVAAAGAVTATDQSMTATDGTGSSSETLSGLIQFSAAVVAGDSGGPLVDSQGEVVGITTAASTSQSSVMAYAIKIEDALAIAIHIEQGVATDGIVLGYPAFLGVSLSSDGTATLAGVLAGTPAASAGLAAGDTITSVDGVAVSSGTELSAALATYKPGDTVVLTWESGTTGTTGSASVTLIEGPAA